MRALVTGASGFVGSYVVERLLSLNHEVAILNRPGSNLWRLEPHQNAVVKITGDMACIEQSHDRIAEFGPDAVFHLAWYGVGNHHRNEDDQLWRNLTGSLRLATIARDIGCKAFIGFGSQAEYGPQDRPIAETAPTSPTTMYGTVKLSTCLLTKQLLAESETRFVWLRLFSSYGPKDAPGWLVPYLIRKLREGERPALTAGEQIWDYLYVADAANAIVTAAMSTEAHGIYNLGSGEANSLRTIIERVRDAIDPDLPLGFGQVPYRADQVMFLQADISRIQKDIGWKPTIPLADGIKRTVDWFSNPANLGMT